MQTVIRQYCKDRSIRIIEHPSGAVRFIGDGVDVAYAKWQYVKVADLRRDDPVPKRQARAGLV